MSRKRPRHTQEEGGSSPDPLGFSGQDSLLQPSTPKRHAPNRRRDLSLDSDILRGKSPAKTVYIDPESDDGKSPYRIRVTVQAEPCDEHITVRSSPAKGFTTRRTNTRSQSPIKVKTTTVPLRREDERRKTRSGTPAPRKKRATPRKSMTLTEINEWYDGSFQLGRNQPSPAKTGGSERFRKYAAPAKKDEDLTDDTETDYLDSMVAEPSIMPSSPAKPARRTSPRKRQTSTGMSIRRPSKEGDILQSTESEDGMSNRVSIGAESRASSERQLGASGQNQQSSPQTRSTPPRHLLKPFRETLVTTTISGNPVLLPQQSARKANRIAFSPLLSRVVREPVPLDPSLPAQSADKSKAAQASSSIIATSGPINMIRNDDESSDSGDGIHGEDSNEDEMMSGAAPIGDDTMMKSMDMTIVSPSALYSRLDIHSSVLHGTPATNKRRRATTAHENEDPAALQPGIIEPEHSSPRVQWSSPLVLSDQKHTPNAQARPIRSSSVSLQSQPVVQSVTQVPRYQLPTPDSDEMNKESTSQSQHFEEPNAGITHLEPTGAIADPTAAHLRQQTSDNPHNAKSSFDIATTQMTFEPAKIIDASGSTGPSRASDSWQDVAEEPRDSDPVPAEETMDLWQVAGDHTSSFVDDSHRSARPTAASAGVGEAWRRSRVTSAQHSRVELSPTASSQSESVEPRRKRSRPRLTRIERQPANETSDSDTIARLFDAALQQSFGQSKKTDMDEGASDVEDPAQQDLSALLQKRVASTMADVDFSLIGKKMRPVANQSGASHHSSLPMAAAGGSQAPVTRLAPAAAVILPHSPRRSSPLKHRIQDDDDGSADEESSSNHFTMLSDVQQLQTELRAAERPAYPDRRPQRKSLLKITQERQARASLRLPVDSDVFDSSLLDTFSSDGSATGTSGLLHAHERASRRTARLTRTFYLSSNTAAHPALLPAFGEETTATGREVSAAEALQLPHRLLDAFRQLPRMHPWTDNHFQALLSLYKHWKTHEYHYNTSNPENAKLLTPSWRKYIDMDFYNWGYDLKLSGSLVMIAVLFAQLLRLETCDEYESLYGESIRFGVVAERTETHGPITDWHIVLRLCTVILGDVIRAEEAKGVVIDRRPALKWRMKGQVFWRRGWFAGLL